MATSQMATNAPNGAVTVANWMRNAENNRFSNGILQGFTPALSGLNLSPAGSSGLNYCLGRNSNGDTEIMGSNTSDTTTLQLSAPTTSGQSVVYSIVVCRDTTVKTNANNGVGSISMFAIPGASTTTGNAVAPTEAVIRASIPNGATAMLSVVMDITVPYGTTALNSAMVRPWYSGLNVVDVSQYFMDTGSEFHSWKKNIHAVQVGGMVVGNIRVERTQDSWDCPVWGTSPLYNIPRFLAAGPNTDLHIPTFGNALNPHNVGIQIADANMNVRCNNQIRFNIGTWFSGNFSWMING